MFFGHLRWSLSHNLWPWRSVETFEIAIGLAFDKIRNGFLLCVTRINIIRMAFVVVTSSVRAYGMNNLNRLESHPIACDTVIDCLVLFICEFIIVGNTLLLERKRSWVNQTIGRTRFNSMQPFHKGFFCGPIDEAKEKTQALTHYACNISIEFVTMQQSEKNGLSLRVNSFYHKWAIQ